MDKGEVKAVIKYFCKKEIQIHDNLGTASPFYSVVKRWAVEFRRAEEPGRL